MKRPRTWYPYAAFMGVLAGVAFTTYLRIPLWGSLASGILFGYFTMEAFRAVGKEMRRR